MHAHAYMHQRTHSQVCTRALIIKLVCTLVSRKHAHTQVAAGLEAKDAETKARLAVLARSLKGKDYSYDHQVGLLHHRQHRGYCIGGCCIRGCRLQL